jgi:putative sigma-54 modulation protein
MKLTIQSLHFVATEKLNKFATDKLDKLSHLYERIESANVIFKLDKSDKTENKICEIKLAIPGNDLFVKRQSKTFEAATTETIDALEQQIKKAKEKLENREYPNKEVEKEIIF